MQILHKKSFPVTDKCRYWLFSDQISPSGHFHRSCCLHYCSVNSFDGYVDQQGHPYRSSENYHPRQASLLIKTKASVLYCTCGFLLFYLFIYFTETAQGWFFSFCLFISSSYSLITHSLGFIFCKVKNKMRKRHLIITKKTVVTKELLTS